MSYDQKQIEALPFFKVIHTSKYRDVLITPHADPSIDDWGVNFTYRRHDGGLVTILMPPNAPNNLDGFCVWLDGLTPEKVNNWINYLTRTKTAKHLPKDTAAVIVPFKKPDSDE